MQSHSTTPAFGDPRLPSRFWDKIRVRPDDCWEWTAYRNASGYGTTTYQGRRLLAHRLSYEILVGTFPKGLHSDHLCRNRACVNPAHIEPVTAQVNVLRGNLPGILRARAAAQTHCLKGHLFDEINTYRHGNQRHCRKCRADIQRAIRRRAVT